MTLTLTTREVQDGDWNGIAELVNLYETDGLTGEIMLARSNRFDTTAPRVQLVTVTPEGKVVANARSLRRHSDPEGKFSIYVYVHPDAGGKGLGLQLLKRVESHALENGATFLITYITEKCERGVAFAEKAGYVRNQHLFESVLSVPDFDATPYMVRRMELEQAGYRFFTLAVAGDTDEHRRRLYELDVDTDIDTPGVENWGIRSYEQYLVDEVESYGYTPHGIHIAAFGDEWVAVSSLRPSPIEGTFHVDYTGVRREHRGRGLAQLLKAWSITFAQSAGAKTVSTNNDERNASMLAINQKMGFVSEPGFFVYRKELSNV